MVTTRLTYAQAILQGFRYLLSNYPNVFVIGQGLWSPWYVGTSMPIWTRNSASSGSSTARFRRQP